MPRKKGLEKIPSDQVFLNWFKVPGNYHRYMKADGRKGTTGEGRLEVVKEVSQILASQGYPSSISATHQRLIKLTRWYAWAREQALDGKPPEDVKKVFPYYYDLVDYFETQPGAGTPTKSSNNNSSTTYQHMTSIETQPVASTPANNHNSTTHQHSPSHAPHTRQPIVISSSLASDISECSHDDDQKSLGSIDEDHQPTDIIDSPPPPPPTLQQQQSLTATMENVGNDISHTEDAMEVVTGSSPTPASGQQQQRHGILQQQQQPLTATMENAGNDISHNEDAMEVVTGSSPTAANGQQQQRHGILQQPQQQISSSHQDILEQYCRQYEMMERLIQRQQQQTLEQQAHSDRIKQLRLRLSLLDRMTKAGSSKEEIAHHINQLQ